MPKKIWIYRIHIFIWSKEVDWMYRASHKKKLLCNKNFTNYGAEFKLLNKTFIFQDAMNYGNMNVRPNFEIHKEYM